MRVLLEKTQTCGGIRGVATRKCIGGVHRDGHRGADGGRSLLGQYRGARSDGENPDRWWNRRRVHQQVHRRCALRRSRQRGVVVVARGEDNSAALVRLEKTQTGGGIRGVATRKCIGGAHRDGHGSAVGWWLLALYGVVVLAHNLMSSLERRQPSRWRRISGYA